MSRIPDQRSSVAGGRNQRPSHKKMMGFLVENAFDFVMRSIDDLREQPKYAVINFYAAVELFLKARLMDEHWTLVVARGKDPDLDEFVVGNFVSVTLEEAATRLHKVVKSGLTENEKKVFDGLRRHRNKMVHFFHEATSVPKSAKLKSEIAKEHVTAWFLLHQLMSGRWSKAFKTWSEKIAAIDGLFRGHRVYLEVVFESVSSQLSQARADGKCIDVCPACDFESQVSLRSKAEPFTENCLVCGNSSVALWLRCKTCSKALTLRNEGFGQCSKCGSSIEPDDLVEFLKDNEIVSAHFEGNCSDCDGYHTVCELEGGGYFCTSCFGSFRTMQDCDYCSEPNTGDMENSYALGCNMCDGRYGDE